MELLEATPIPWAQGVVSSNLAAPTKEIQTDTGLLRRPVGGNNERRPLLDASCSTGKLVKLLGDFQVDDGRLTAVKRAQRL